MLNRIFGGFCIVSALAALLLGNCTQLSASILDGAAEAVKLILSLCGMMCLWCGILRVLEQAGCTRILAKCLRPIFRIVFPTAFGKQRGDTEIAASVSANLLGIGNAATPLGIRAMQKMNETNPTPGVATDDMITFVVLNTASFSLLPTTLLALRRAAGSANPFAIVIPTWISSLIGTLTAVLLCRAFARPRRKKR